MIEFLNYVPVEGSVGELLMGLIKVGASLVFVTFLILLVWIIVNKVEK